MIAEAIRAIDDFIAKQTDTNPHLEALKRTPGYDKFRQSFATGIKGQASKVADDFRTLSDPRVYDQSYDPLTDTQKTHLNNWVGRHMPPIHQLVPRYPVFNYFRQVFNATVKNRYGKWGFKTKAVDYNFEVSNPHYTAQLNSHTDYLLHKSTIDDTTKARIINVIDEGKQAGMTNDEVADSINDEFDQISGTRADMIARTETANVAGQADMAAATENGVQTKHWVVAGPGCPICDDNEADGSIDINDSFSSGDDTVPAHPNCECYVDFDEIDLDALADSLWDGS